MKLLTITTRYLLILVLTVLALWTAVFYFSLQEVIYIEIDEHLNSRVFEIKQLLESNPSLILISKKSHKTDFTIEEINKDAYNVFRIKYPKGKPENFMRFVEAENEDEPFRKMESVFLNKNNYYKVTVEASLVDTKEMLNVILLDMFALSIVLAVFILFFNRLLLRRLWKTFYNTLDKIKGYRIDKERTVLLEQSKITEFEELNNSVKELIETNNKVYLQQKQFIENASHEIQTPLAIAMSKLELFTEGENLTENQAELVKSVRQNLGRLSRLNRSLMLLSKIDNRQFENIEWIDVAEKIEKILFEYEEMIEFKGLTCRFVAEASPLLHIHPDLADILFSNLLRNAIFHNISGGHINISVQQSQVIIENTGKETSENPEEMFGRFRKGTGSSQSQGLGLAIVASICRLYDYKIVYTIRENIHIVSFSF